MNQFDPPKRDRVAPRPHRLVRRLCLLYTAFVVASALLLALAALPLTVLPSLKAVAQEAVFGGLGALVVSALLVAITGLAGTLALTTARYRDQAPAGSWLAKLEPGIAARQGQALIVTVGAVLTLFGASLLWPRATTPAPGADIAAAFVFGLAFISLVAERSMQSFPEAQLPEAPGLRRLLLLTTLLLLVAACIELGRGAGLAWVHWPALALIIVPCAVVCELALRALARMFLPAPADESARAASDSILATILTGGPRAPGTLLRTHLGLDFTRSWALSFLSKAIMPALIATAVLCWGLSGLKLIDLGQRGIYERFGAPVAVYGPGLHLLLPWPLGRLRAVEYGTIHSVSIGVDQSQQEEAEPAVAAEAAPPTSLNRLWESSHPGQAQYLVPSPSTGQQGFQTVSTEISVLYRVGLTDNAALESVYTVAEPEQLIKEAASRLVLEYFNSRTLEAVLGAQRENIAGTLRDQLTADLDAQHAGIDVVSVLIEEIHPPAGAASAYHAVQAAEINANASISNEIGRSKRTAGIAQQEAHQLLAAANAKATETIDAANSDAYRFDADRASYAEGGRSFLLERSYTNLRSALSQTPLTIIDHRLSPSQAPILDMRSYNSAAAPAAATTNNGAAAPNTAATPARAGTTTPTPITPGVETTEDND